MKRILQLIVLAGLAVFQTSCGLPMALTRSAGRMVDSVGAMANGM